MSKRLKLLLYFCPWKLTGYESIFDIQIDLQINFLRMKYRPKLYDKLPAIKLQFMAGIELGVPSKDCKNFGICRITPVGKTNALPNRSKEECGCGDQCRGVVTVLESNEVEICFLRKTINSADYSKYFMSGYFLVEEDHSFPDENNLPEQIQIFKGEYPVSIDASLIRVVFNKR